MLSYYNTPTPNPNNLTNEDIENLIEYYAVDVETAGYDVFSGHGRIDAYETMRHIEKPKYEVKHFSFSAPQSNRTLIDPSRTIKIDYEYLPTNSSNFLDAGFYEVEVYEYNVQNNHSLANNESIVHITGKPPCAWPRNASSNLYANAYSLDNIPDLEIVNVNHSSINIKGYQYFVKHEVSNPTVSINKWYPDLGSNNVKFSYSLNTYDPTKSSIDELKNESFKVLPNPSSDFIFIEIGENNLSSIVITNVLGKTININHPIKMSPSFCKVNIQHLTPGVYFISFVDNQIHRTAKVIVQ
jgi:hypothetical protein